VHHTECDRHYLALIAFNQFSKRIFVP